LEKILNFNTDYSLEQFAIRFFESNGAEIEKCPDGLEILLPEELALRLNTPEYLRIPTGKDVEGAQEKFTLHYGSSLLEKMLDVACSNVPLIRCRLNFNYIKREGFDRLIQDQFVFHNAVGKVQSTAEVRTEYLLLNCRYLAQSDEQKEGLVALTFNLESGAQVSNMDRMINTVDKTFETDSKQILLEDRKINAVLTWVQRHAGRILGSEIKPFQESMNRRNQRDVANLEEYYEDLKKEMEDNLKRSGLSDQLISDRKAKISMIPNELEMKKEDLFNKYSIRVKLDLCGGIYIRTPAMKILYQISFGKKQRQLSMIFNPVTKSLDPLICEGCGDSTFNISFCKHLHTLCPVCRGNCPVC